MHILREGSNCRQSIQTQELECCEEHIVHTDAVMAARSAMPAEEITTAASDFFKAFSDKTRLADTGGACVRGAVCL